MCADSFGSELVHAEGGLGGAAKGERKSSIARSRSLNTIAAALRPKSKLPLGVPHERAEGSSAMQGRSCSSTQHLGGPKLS